MNNEELNEYLTNNFSEILPPKKEGYFQFKFKPDFYIKKIIPVFMEKNFTGLKKMLENDSKMSMGYIGQFPPPPKDKDERLTTDELNDYNNKLLIASDNFNKNPFDPDIKESLIKIDEQLKMLDDLLN